jgi:Protein of unknown function (DUF3489)
MSENKVVPISAGMQADKRPRIKVRVTQGASIQIQLTPEEVVSAVLGPDWAAATKTERKFWIAADHTIHVLAPEAAEPEDAGMVFSGLDELAQKTAEWRLRQFVEVWNQLPGNDPVSRFENRRVALARLWQAIQKLELLPPQQASIAPTKRNECKPLSKTKSVIGLLQTPGGVTLEVLMKATGWQAHSVRGFLSGKVAKQLGLPVTSFRKDGERVYQLAAAVERKED